jgi:hypothetical protein
MIVNIKDLNAFGNVMQSLGKTGHAKIAHDAVKKMIELKETQLNLKEETDDEKTLCSLIKDAQAFLRLKEKAKENKRFPKR